MHYVRCLYVCILLWFILKDETKIFFEIKKCAYDLVLRGHAFIFHVYIRVFSDFIIKILLCSSIIHTTSETIVSVIFLGCAQTLFNLPKRSTSQYLIRMLDFVLKSLDKKSTPAILTLLDCQKAFDMVYHNLITSRLIKLDVNWYVINWVKIFLSNRSKCVRIGKLMSSFLPMKRGLAQGTLNGPLTILLVFDPFLQCLQLLSTNLQVFGFVDDATTAAIEL